MHHRHLEKQDGESFGMLMVAKKYWDKVRTDKKRFAENRSENIKVASPNV
jgi:beta-carotene 3-hydroxylase